MSGGLPTAIDPGEIDDGAVVSGQYGHPALRNPTHVHQNHPVVAALRAADGDTLRFAGLILSPEPVDQAGKELMAAHAARLCASLGWGAAIVPKEGGGNAGAGHYINQFFVGVGGEDRAGTPPDSRPGATGPGRKLASLLEDHEIVATVFCGDDYAASEPGAPAEILALATAAGAELLVAGPAFGSGRYGIACGRVAAAAARAGIPALAAMDPSNPGLPAVPPAWRS